MAGIDLVNFGVYLKESKKYEVLRNLLTVVLSKFKTPVSVSFLNLFLNQKMREGTIGEDFLKNKDNQEKFVFYVIGSDLKIQLRKTHNTSDTKLSDLGTQLFEIIDKDQRKLRELQKKFEEKKLTDILYNDFLQIFGSRKNKMKLSFIVRSSHTLKIYSKSDETYVRFLDESETGNFLMDEETVKRYIIEKGFEFIVLQCLKNLLSNFYIPLNQGLLQNCFNFGTIVIDKKFLKKYHEYFEGAGADGITLKNSSRPRYNKSEISKTVVVECSEKDKSKDLMKSIIKFSSEGNRSIVVISGSEETPVIHYNCEVSEQIANLKRLHQFIGNEIKKLDSKH